jgi:hypothetical protein
MDKPDALEFPFLAQTGDEQNHLVSHTRELPAKFKNVTGAGVFGGRIDPGEIKNFHETWRIYLERIKRISACDSMSKHVGKFQTYYLYISSCHSYPGWRIYLEMKVRALE